MAGIDLATAEAKLALYMTAEGKVLAGQEYEIAGRRMKRADLAEIREGIKYWNDWCQRLDPSRVANRVVGVVSV